MFNFFKKIKQKMEIKSQEKTYSHLLKKYTVSDIEFMSQEKNFLILKHSPRCIVSKMIMSDFLKLYNSNHDKFYYLVVDVIESRQLSNELADKYKVIHQSPQVLILSKGNCVYHESHDKINFNEIDENF